MHKLKLKLKLVLGIINIIKMIKEDHEPKLANEPMERQPPPLTMAFIQIYQHNNAYTSKNR